MGQAAGWPQLFPLFWLLVLLGTEQGWVRGI